MRQMRSISVSLHLKLLAQSKVLVIHCNGIQLLSTSSDISRASMDLKSMLCQTYLLPIGRSSLKRLHPRNGRYSIAFSFLRTQMSGNLTWVSTSMYSRRRAWTPYRPSLSTTSWRMSFLLGHLVSRACVSTP